MVKYTILLTRREVAAMDRLTLQIRILHRAVISRSEFVQALIIAAEQRGLSPDDFA